MLLDSFSPNFASLRRLVSLSRKRHNLQITLKFPNVFQRGKMQPNVEQCKHLHTLSGIALLPTSLKNLSIP